MTVRRFRFVKPKLGKIVHFHFHRYLAEGTTTACGIVLVKGWQWATRRTSMRDSEGALPVCKRCVVAKDAEFKANTK